MTITTVLLTDGWFPDRTVRLWCARAGYNLNGWFYWGNEQWVGPFATQRLAAADAAKVTS